MLDTERIKNRIPTRRVKLKYLSISFNSSIQVNSLSDTGKTPVYGASGIAGYTNELGIDRDYLGIVKDGAGAGRINCYKKGSLLSNTLSYIIPQKNVEINWLKYSIISLNLSETIDKTTIPHIYFSDYGNRFLYYLSFEEQNKISKYLDQKCAEIDRLIEIENQQIEKLKEYKQAVITEAVTKGLDKSAPMKPSGVEWIGEIPEDWRICRIKNVAIISNGKEIEADGGEVPVYGSGGIFKYTDKPLFSGTSLLLGRKGTIDKPMLVQGDFWTVDTMFYTSEIRNIAPKYLYYCAKSLICFDFFKSGSVLPSMTQSELNNIFITYPDFYTQNQIVEYLDKKCFNIDSLIEIKQKKIDKQNEYKKSLIYEYVTGKKEVV